MLRKLGGIVGVCAVLGPLAAAAECSLDGFDGVAPAFSGTVPISPADVSRPTTPECLQGLSDPSQENCTAEEVADYSAAVEAYVTALNAFITETDSYARAAAEHANAAVAHAQAAQARADAVFAFATCEAEALRSGQ